MSDDALDGYALAMFDVAKAEGLLFEVEDELFRFSHSLELNTDLLQGISDPGVPADRRQAMIEDLLKGKILPQTVQLISFVVGSGKGRQLQDIVRRLLDMAAAERNKAVAEVRTAVRLDDAQKDQLVTALHRATGKTVEIRTIVDPSVIGGVWAKVGDFVVDGTVRHRLERIKEQLRAAT